MSERIVRGRVDRSGALVSADAPLLRLQQRAGAVGVLVIHEHAAASYPFSQVAQPLPSAVPAPLTPNTLQLTGWLDQSAWAPLLKTLKLDLATVEPQVFASPKHLIAPGSPVGTVVQALRHVGSMHAADVAQVAVLRLSSRDKKTLAANAAQAPAWMRPAFTSSTYFRNASLLSSSDGM